VPKVTMAAHPSKTQQTGIVLACTHVPDLFGRIAEYCWEPDSADVHDWRRFQTMDDETPGRRRGFVSGASSPMMPRKRSRHSPPGARRGGGIVQLLMASRTMLDIGILGIKERRPASALNRLCYNLLCDTIRRSFEAAWRRTRGLQRSRSLDHDFATALEILDMHTSATIVCH